IEDPPVRPGREREHWMLHRAEVILQRGVKYVADEEIRRRVPIRQQGPCPAHPAFFLITARIFFRGFIDAYPKVIHRLGKPPHRRIRIASPWDRSRFIVGSESLSHPKPTIFQYRTES